MNPYITKDFDFEISGSDIKTDQSLETSIRLALSLTNKWWGNQYDRKVGGDIFDLWRGGKLDDNTATLIKAGAERALAFLLNYVKSYTVEVVRETNAVKLTVEIILKTGKEKWEYLL